MLTDVLRNINSQKWPAILLRKDVFHCRCFPVSCLETFQGSFLTENFRATACGKIGCNVIT